MSSTPSPAELHELERDADDLRASPENADGDRRGGFVERHTECWLVRS